MASVMPEGRLQCTMSRGLKIVADTTIDQVAHKSFDAIALPGGMPNGLAGYSLAHFRMNETVDPGQCSAQSKHHNQLNLKTCLHKIGLTDPSGPHRHQFSMTSNCLHQRLHVIA